MKLGSDFAQRLFQLSPTMPTNRKPETAKAYQA
ncbi:MAG: hypothetical protein ACI8UP_005196, partial [Porticoccaceae bacterium]